MITNVMHLKFIAEYLKDGNGSRAAREAGYSPRSAASQATRLLNREDVKEALGETRAEIADALNVTIEGISEMYLQAFRVAQANDQASAMTGAATGLATLHGLIVHKSESDVTRRTVARLPAPIKDPEQWLQTFKPKKDERPTTPSMPGSPTVN